MTPVEGYFLSKRLIMRLMADHFHSERYICIYLKKEDKNILHTELTKKVQRLSQFLQL